MTTEQGNPYAWRKKPVEIEAWRWLFTEDQIATPTWMNDACNVWPSFGGAAFEPEHPEGPRIVISTLEGVMIAKPGDWIIRGVAGEIYPCKPEIFDATYEKA